METEIIVVVMAVAVRHNKIYYMQQDSAIVRRFMFKISYLGN